MCLFYVAYGSNNGKFECYTRCASNGAYEIVSCQRTGAPRGGEFEIILAVLSGRYARPMTPQAASGHLEIPELQAHEGRRGACDTSPFAASNQPTPRGSPLLSLDINLAVPEVRKIPALIFRETDGMKRFIFASCIRPLIGAPCWMASIEGSLLFAIKIVANDADTESARRPLR